MRPVRKIDRLELYIRGVFAAAAGVLVVVAE
jgi:hypothetical protein